jgi:gluconolactonase
MSDLPAELLRPGAELRRLGTGFTFTEGPIWNATGEYLLFSDMPGDVRRRWSASGGIEEVMRPSFKTNGMVYDGEGRLLVCEHATSSLIRVAPSGERELMAYHHRGTYLNSPNDVVTRSSDGTIYFSDPIFGRVPHFGVERALELGYQGVYRVPREGGDAELVAGEDEFEQPNGLCFSPDESLLYINDSPRAHIKVWDVADDGSLSGGRMFFEGIGTGVVEEGIPDGMKCDELGNIWVSGPGGVWVISPAGERLGMIEVPENVGNLTFGGDRWRSLFVAASTSLYVIDTAVGSTPLPYH